MFKNLILCRISGLPELPVVEAALASGAFMACGATQPKSTGWVPPRGTEHGALVESIAGQWIARFMIETKAVPADALRRRVDEMAQQIEATTGRVPGRLERKDMKVDALQELLPHAFPRRQSVWVWIDPAAGLLAIVSALGVGRGTAQRLQGGYWPRDARRMLSTWQAYKGRSAVQQSGWFLRRVHAGGVIRHAGREWAGLAAHTGQTVAVARTPGGLLAQTLDMPPARLALQERS